MTSRLITSTLKTACLTQITLSTISIAFGARVTGESPISEPDHNEITFPLSHDVKTVITSMYTGRGVPLSKFSKDAVFEDPAVKSVGRDEIAEAFRALKVCSPTSLSHPRIVGNATTLDTEDGIGCMVVLKLRQRYFGRLTVDSLVFVETGQDGLIRRVEERWNGAPLVAYLGFGAARRVNGLFSYAVTSLFI